MDFVEENDVTSEEVLHAEFGTPSEVVNTYFSSVDSEYVVKRVKHSRWLKVSAVTVFFAAIIGVGIYGGVKTKEYIAFMEEKVAMKELAKGDVDAPEYTESEWKKYSTFTKYAEIPLYAVVGEYTGFNNKIKFIVLDDCRIVALDTSNEKNNVFTENTYAAHLYNGSWRSPIRQKLSRIKKKLGINLDKIFPRKILDLLRKI